MQNLDIWYPFFYALCAVIGVFAVLMLDIMAQDLDELIAKRRTKLRDKLHTAMTQTVKRAAA